MTLADQFAADGGGSGPNAAIPQMSLASQFAADAGAPPSASQQAPVQPSTAGQRFLTGLTDLPYKATQLITHALPDSWNAGLDRFDQAISGSNYVKPQPIDQVVNQREAKYQAQRAAAGSTGFDWMRLAGNVADPANYLVPGGAETTLGRIGLGAAQGAATSILNSPTTGSDQNNFWRQQLAQGVVGAAGGGAATALGESVSPLVSSGWNKIKSLLPGGSSPATAAQASNIADQAFVARGINPQTVDPTVRAQFVQQVQDSLLKGVEPDARTAANMAEAQSLPVPVPMLRGQASRDPMQFAKEQNLRGITGVGEPITSVMGSQNRALIDNLDAMGAKGAPNVVDAGQTAINHLQSLDAQARKSVSAAYDAFKNSTGKSLDVPLQGVAQDYARIANEYGMNTIPQGVRNQLDALGLLSGKQMKTFSIDDAENALKIINKNYDPSNRPQASALDEIRRSIQGAIANGAGSDAQGAEAAQLAQQARAVAAQRFKLIDTVPAYKAAITGAAPDKFLQKFFWNGNAGDIANTKTLLSADPQALGTVKSAIMGDIKQTALNNQSPENGIFSQAKYNGLLRDQNNARRLGALFEPGELGQMQRLGNVAENVILPPKAAAVNTSNTAGAAANLVQTAAQGGLGLRALNLLGKAEVPVVSPVAAGVAGRASAIPLRDLVRQSTQPLSAADLDILPYLTGRSGVLGGVAAGRAQR